MEVKTPQMVQHIPAQIQSFFGVVMILMLLASVGATVGVLISSFGYPFELFTHLSVQIFIFSLLAFIVCVLKRNFEFGVLALALVLFHFSFVAPVIIPLNSTASSGERDYRLMVANVLYKNDEHQLFLDVIKEQDPDIIVVVEGTWRWKEALQSLDEAYPHFQRSPQYIFGGARVFLYSKVAFEQIDIDVPYSYNRPLLAVRMLDPEKPFLLIATHPYPPNLPNTYAMRNQQKQELSEFIQKQNEPLVVAGDLNNTVWSPYFQKFLHENNLKNARQGFGWNPSWEPEASFIKIPIDHILYKGDFQIHNFYSAPYIGSDHYPIVADFSVLP